MIANSADSFGWLTRALHWAVAALILGLVGLGWYFVELGYMAPSYKALLEWHQALGVLVLVLVAVKFAWHLVSRPPGYLASVGMAERIAAGGIRWLFYVLMVAIPVSGYFVSSTEDGPIDMLGLFDLPALFEGNSELNEIALALHYYGAYVIAALAALHAAGALKHHFVDKDRTLTRMVRGR